MGKKQIIVLVDDNLANLSSGKNLLKERYDVFTVPSGESLFTLLENVRPDIILLDIEMPAMSGYEVIKRLKDDSETAMIPVIFLTAYGDAGSELEGLSLGAVDFISKPFSPPLLRKRIENHLLITSQNRALSALNEHLRARVDETSEVSSVQNTILQAVVDMAPASADAGRDTRVYAAVVALLDGARADGIYADAIAACDDAALGSHAGEHEWWDGTGSPDGLAGEAIPLVGRVLAICNAYDALTTPRPDSKHLSVEETASVIAAGAGTHFDPLLVNAFTERFTSKDAGRA
jgi:response regulator RpfG family c-di-GMP phosphodiesterase